MKYDFFIFDFDGTLCNTNTAVEYCIIETLKEFKINYVEKSVNLIISKGFNIQDTFLKLTSLENVDKIINTYRSIYNSGKGLEMSNLYPNIHQVFDYLKENDAKISIVSNKGITAITEALCFFNLESYIEICIAEMPGVFKKPNPMAFHEIIKRKYPKLNNEKVLMVGDTEADIMFSQNSHISACWAKYGYGNKETCLKLKPNYCIDEFKSLLEIN